MQREEAAWWQAIEDEEAASAAVVAAERDLQQLVQHHLASSPTVDNAVSELALRRSEYSLTLRTTYEAAALYHRTEWDVILAESHRRREDHEQRVRAVRQQTPAGRQQAVTTSGLGVAHSRPSSSESGSPPRPTKCLNLGRSSIAPAAQTSKSEQSGQSEQSEQGEESKQNEQSEQSEEMKQSEQSERGSGDSEDSSSSVDDGGFSSVRGAGSSINRLMLYDPRVHGVPPIMQVPAPLQARRIDSVSDCESESKSQRANSEDNEEESESAEESEFVRSEKSKNTESAI